MAFKQEFLAALQSGMDDKALLEIVRRHFRDDTGKDAYRTLEQIWLDLGFSDSDEESALRDNLEFVMERVWYFGPSVT